MNNDTLKRIILICFISVPLLSSIISTVHLVDMFYLGNPSWISYTIAIAIEVGAVASFLTLSILSKLNKTIVWSMFILLFFMQVMGNVYFSYDWVTKKIAVESNWLVNFKEMIEFFVSDIELKTTKMILSMIVGIPIPLISVFLLKSLSDYIGSDNEDSINNAMNTEPPLPMMELIPEPGFLTENPTAEKEENTEEDLEPVSAEVENIFADEEEKKPESDQIHIIGDDVNILHPARV